ncbi:MAG: hypothetical protein ACM3WV_00010 [Bacillota bacterium]
MGKQKVPDQIGTETGPPRDPREGHPVPREIKSQEAQYKTAPQSGLRKDKKLKMSKKVRRED